MAQFQIAVLFIVDPPDLPARNSKAGNAAAKVGSGETRELDHRPDPKALAVVPVIPLARIQQHREYRRLALGQAERGRQALCLARGQAFAVRRRSRLDGRANVQVVSAGAATRVTVNIRYTITVSIAATRLDGRPAGNEQVILEPTTTRPFTGGELTCAALGVVEARLLDAAAR